MPGKPAGGFFEIRRADDLLAVEHGPRPMAGDLHRDALRDAAVHETPDNGPAEVMAESPGDAHVDALKPPLQGIDPRSS